MDPRSIGLKRENKLTWDPALGEASSSAELMKMLDPSIRRGSQVNWSKMHILGEIKLIWIHWSQNRGPLRSCVLLALYVIPVNPVKKTP